MCHSGFCIKLCIIRPLENIDTSNSSIQTEFYYCNEYLHACIIWSMIKFIKKKTMLVTYI